MVAKVCEKLPVLSKPIRQPLPVICVEIEVRKRGFGWVSHSVRISGQGTGSAWTSNPGLTCRLRTVLPQIERRFTPSRFPRRSGLLDVAPQPIVDDPPIEISVAHQSDDESVVLCGVSGQFETVQPEMHICGGDGGALVSVEERVILNQTLQQGGRFGNRVLVIACLWSEYGCFKSSQVTDTLGASELLDEQVVDGEDFYNGQILGQLLGQLLVEDTVAGD